MNTTTRQMDPQEYLNTAFDIGTRLVENAIWDANRCNWIGDALIFGQKGIEIVKKSCDIDVYNGTSGIALFLGKLYQISKDEVILETLNGVITQIITTIDKIHPYKNYGFYEGGIGIAITLIKLGTSMDRPDCINKGMDLIHQIGQNDIGQHEVDIMNGIAGSISGLIPLYRKNTSPEILQLLIKCGAHLLTHAIKEDTHWSWSSLKDQEGLTGFSHGAAGISLALLELYSLTNDPTYLEGGMKGFNFERMHFNAQLGNWQDLRKYNTGKNDSDVPVYGESWCHGAPGIALTRLRAFELTGNPQFREEAEIALNTTYQKTMALLSQSQMPVNYSLCHGLAGNGDILLEGGTRLNNPHLVQAAHSIGVWGVERFRKTNSAWPSGIIDISGKHRDKTIAPGLMQGFSGTGYFYLRLYNISNTENILMPGSIL